MTRAVRLRTTIVLAVLAALLGGAYYRVEVRGREARQRALLAERRVVSFDAARVREITIEKPAERVVLRGAGDRWRIVAPVDEPADERVVEGLLSLVHRLEKVRSLDGLADLKMVGLDAPAVILGLGLENGETLTLLLGGSNPVHTGVYAAVEGAPLVFLAPALLAAELAAYGLDRPHARLTVVDERGRSRTLAVAQAADDPGVLYAQVEGVSAVHITGTQLLTDLAIEPDVLRNHQLLVYDQREVERITIRYPGDTLVLDRAGDRWRVTRPVEGEAVRSTVENLLEVLPNLRYATVEPTPPGDLRRYGLDPPRLAVTLGLRGGRELPTLAVGREERGAHFVMVGNRAPVYTVDARLIRVIPPDPADAKRYPLPEQLKREVDKTERNRS